MVPTFFIIGISITLFLYWFRYTCLLILSAKTTQDYAARVVAANRLEFLAVQSALLEGAQPAGLGPLEQALNRDYELLGKLLKHSRAVEDPSAEIEQQMLRFYYCALRTWSRAVRRFSPAAAHRAMLEMAEVLSHFANLAGERAFAGSAA
jgi:hypothetical protein